MGLTGRAMPLPLKGPPERDLGNAEGERSRPA